MPRLPSFLEYMNEKGNVVDTPKVEKVPDYHGPDEKTPEGSKVPYKTPVANKAPAKGESGLAELGDEKLKYDPTKNSKEEVKKDVMKEYVNEKRKVVEKAREDIKADYKGPFKDAPEGKNSAPYVAKGESGKKKGEKGLAELGHEGCKYEPDTKNAKKPTKTEGFLNKTKGMSLSEFTRYMLEECGCGQVSGDDLPSVTAYTTGKFQPHPPEVIRYISVLADKNQGILENLVSTVISMGYLDKLLKAIFEHPQAYEELTNLLGDEKDGPSRCGAFAGAMNNSYSKFLQDQAGLYESVSSPLGFDMEDLEGSDEDEEMPEDSEDEGDSDLGDDEDLDLGSDEDEESDHLDDEGDEDSDGHDSEEDFEDEESEEDSEIPSDERGEDPESGHERKLKKKFAHDHLLGAMRNHEHMFKAMRG